MVATTSGCLLDMVMSDTGPLSLGVEDNKSLTKRITRLYTLMTRARAISTKQDTGSNWEYWLQWCTMYNTPPVRPQELQPGVGTSVPKPTSALNALRGVRRVHYLRHRQQTPLVWANGASSGDEDPEPEARHVLSAPNDTVILNRDGDDMWLGGVQLTQHVTRS